MAWVSLPKEKDSLDNKERKWPASRIKMVNKEELGNIDSLNMKNLKLVFGGYALLIAKQMQGILGHP